MCAGSRSAPAGPVPSRERPSASAHSVSAEPRLGEPRLGEPRPGSGSGAAPGKNQDRAAAPASLSRHQQRPEPRFSQRCGKALSRCPSPGSFCPWMDTGWGRAGWSCAPVRAEPEFSFLLFGVVLWLPQGCSVGLSGPWQLCGWSWPGRGSATSPEGIWMSCVLAEQQCHTQDSWVPFLGAVF